MIVQCPACNSRYRIRDDNIPPTGGKIRCPSCGHSFIVYPKNVTSETASTAVQNRGEIKEYMEKRQKGEIDAVQDIPEDGTVEIQNPMAYWEQLQNAQVDEKIDDSSSEYTGDEEPFASEYDSDPTEIVLPENLNVPFPGTSSKKGPPSIPSPTGGKANLPNLPPPRSKRASTPPIPRSNTPAPQGEDPFRPPQRDQVRENAAQGAGYPPSQNFEGSTEDEFKPAGSSSHDILAAIEEASQAHDDGPPTPGGPSGAGNIARPDPDHAGPWKLKTNFGLTYEFPDSRSLKNWLSSREELTGYSLSADGSNFFALSEFPQVANRASGPSQSIASSGLIPQPGQLPPMPSDSQQPQNEAPNQPQRQSPDQSASAGFASSNRGFGTGRLQPVPENPAGPGVGAPISNEFHPPSRETRYNGLLWVIFFALLAVCIVVALQTFEIYDFKALLSSEDGEAEWIDPDPVIPALESDEMLGLMEPDRAEIERLLKEANREIRENRLQSALDRIKTVRMLEPDHLEALELAIETHEKLGQTERADELRERAETLRSEANDASRKDAIDSPKSAEDDDVPGTTPPARDK